MAAQSASDAALAVLAAADAAGGDQETFPLQTESLAQVTDESGGALA